MANELLECETIEEDNDKEFSGEDNSSSEISETEDSETTSGEVCSVLFICWLERSACAALRRCCGTKCPLLMAFFFS